jgi:hypothetical protein
VLTIFRFIKIRTASKLGDRRFEEENDMNPEDKSFLEKKITERRKEYRGNEIRFAIGYFSLVVVSAMSSALAGFILQVTWFGSDATFQKNLATALAFLTTFIVTLNTTVGLNSKWRANRIARCEIDNLKLELEEDNQTKNNIISRLKEVEKSRNSAIVG